MNVKRLPYQGKLIILFQLKNVTMSPIIQQARINCYIQNVQTIILDVQKMPASYAMSHMPWDSVGTDFYGTKIKVAVIR